MYIPPFTITSLSPMERQFSALFGNEFGVMYGINDKQLLLLLNSNPAFTAADIAERLGMTKRGVEKLIKKFRDLGVLSRHGSTKNGLWIIHKDA